LKIKKIIILALSVHLTPNKKNHHPISVCWDVHLNNYEYQELFSLMWLISSVYAGFEMRSSCVAQGGVTGDIQPTKYFTNTTGKSGKWHWARSHVMFGGRGWCWNKPRCLTHASKILYHWDFFFFLYRVSLCNPNWPWTHESGL
jgi:hypothetical protein